MSIDEVPDSLYQAGTWLRERHPLLDELVARVAGVSPNWLDEIAGAVFDTAEYAQARAAYEGWNPPPTDHNSAAYAKWEAAGPKNSARGRAYSFLAPEEKRIILLVATLGSQDRDVVPGTDRRQSSPRVVPWSPRDLGKWDDRGVAIFNDWVRILHAQVL